MVSQSGEVASATSGAAQASSELREYLSVSKQSRRLFPRAALVGLCAGIIAIVFRTLLSEADIVRNALVGWAHQYASFGWIFPISFGAAGAALSVLLVRRYAPETSGSGIPHLKATLHRLRELRWRRVLPIKMIGGVLAIGSGMALGREGPTVQMGGAVGDAVARWLNVPARERLVLIAAGAGAGLAAAFNAPLSGLVFILEEVQRDFRPIVFGAVFLAAAVADIVARLAAGQLPVFAVPSYAVLPLANIPIFIILGGVAGILGVAFNKGLLVTQGLFSRFSDRTRILIAALIGASAGLIAWFSPQAVGGGHDLAEQVLAGHFMLAAIPLWFLLRFGLTLVSYGTGAPGGIFAPLLVLGALIGLAIGEIAHFFAPAAVPLPAVFAVIGMAAYFTAIVRAPLTGVVLILEMTGNYSQMLPLLVSCFTAYAVAEALKDLPIYEALLEIDLLRGGLRPAYKESIVVEMTVETGASFVGQEVKNLGLPPGCILVRCDEGGHEWVPTATTRLEEHMRITAVIAPEAANALAVLRRGCEAGH
ncbi:MAG: H(+)/Cl(-) exchange transporter ClcA [Chloroflexi bacterium]|nr:H(+)/Cl(-) exchange transporter ClcA [Chloroflexota bacterium]